MEVLSYASVLDSYPAAVTKHYGKRNLRKHEFVPAPSARCTQSPGGRDGHGSRSLRSNDLSPAAGRGRGYIHANTQLLFFIQSRVQLMKNSAAHIQGRSFFLS